MTEAALQKFIGVIAWLFAVVPITLLSAFLFFFLKENQLFAIYDEWVFSVLVIYIAIGWRSLISHAQAISHPLKNADLAKARLALSYIVSRDTQTLSPAQISSAATESVLENGGDAIFCAIFWFLIGGVPAVVLYRCVNTLDAMWGYKTPRYIHFGWMAARFDDLMNYIPARLTALSYAISGNSALAMGCWRAQGFQWKSPNAGPVMAAGAGALNLRLGGGSFYHGQWQERPVLGSHKSKEASYLSIQAACMLVDRVLVLWLCLLFFITLLLCILPI